MKQKLLWLAFQVFVRCGPVGERVLHRLGFSAFRSEDFYHAHLATCSGADIETSLRPQGYVKRCRSCGVPTVIHFACWEQKGGYMPPEVVKWIVEEIRVLATVEGLDRALDRKVPEVSARDAMDSAEGPGNRPLPEPGVHE